MRGKFVSYLRAARHSKLVPLTPPVRLGMEQMSHQRMGDRSLRQLQRLGILG